MNKFSYFKAPITNTIPSKEISIKEYSKIVKGDIWKEKINLLRQDSSQKDTIKKTQLDYVIPSGIFKERKKEGLVKLSSLISLDLDKVVNLKILKKKLSKDKHVLLVHTSPSGKGLKLFVRFENLTIDNYENNWKMGRDYFIEKCGVPKENFDEQTKDISRACFVSYDPDLYFNEEAIPFQATNENIVSEKEKINLESILDKKIIDAIIPHWEDGNRQNLAMSLSAYLRKEGYGMTKIKNIINSICKITNDEEISQREGAVDSTFKKNIDEIKGYSGLEEILPFEALILFPKLEKENKIPKINKEELQIRTLYDILKNGFPEIEWKISKIIPEEGIVLIFGKTATFKSWIAMQIALSYVFGKSFLDKFDTKKGNVLYLDEENGRSLLPSRLGKLIKGNFSDEDNLNLKNLNIATYSGIKLDDPNSIIVLNNIIKEKSINLIIYDSIVRGMSGDEDSAKDVRLVHENIKKIISQNKGVSFLLLHHATKSGGGINSARGSGDWVNMADVVLMPTVNKKNSNLINITMEKNRYFDKNKLPEFSILLEDGLNDEIYMNLFKGTISRLTAVDSCCSDLRVWVEKSDKRYIATKDIRNSMNKKSHSNNSINDSIKKLTEEGVLCMLKRGKYEILKD